MKKILIFLILALSILSFSVMAGAQTWHPTNQVTIAWDPSVKIQPTDTISYYVYVKFVSTGELLGDIDTDNGKAFLEVTDVQAIISFTAEGKYYVGVATIRLIEGETVPLVSEINWSNENGEYTPDPFGVVYFVAPSPPINLHLQ